MMEYALYAFVVFGLLMGARMTYLLAAIHQGIKRFDLNIESSELTKKRIRRFVYESVFLLSLLIATLLILFLFAHEGVM